MALGHLHEAGRPPGNHLGLGDLPKYPPERGASSALACAGTCQRAAGLPVCSFRSSLRQSQGMGGINAHVPGEETGAGRRMIFALPGKKQSRDASPGLTPSPVLQAKGRLSPACLAARPAVCVGVKTTLGK